MSGVAAPRSQGAGGEQALAGRLGVLVFAALALASFAAFFLAQRLKHIPTAVQELRFDPAFYPEGGGVPMREPISFEIERADRVSVEILDTGGARIAMLARERALLAYTPLKLFWNGRKGTWSRARGGPSGAPAPDGEYRVRVKLAQRGLEVRSPNSVELVRRPR